MKGKKLEMAAADKNHQQQHKYPPVEKSSSNKKPALTRRKPVSQCDSQQDEGQYGHGSNCYDSFSILSSSTEESSFSSDNSNERNGSLRYHNNSTSLSPNRRPDRCGLRVKFASTVKKYKILSIKDYTKDEKKSCWFTSAEKKSRATKRELIVARMESGRPPKSNMTYRGLEAWTRAGATKFDERVELCLNAVMDEQDYQWQIEEEDQDRIAEISNLMTLKSREEALQRALEDRIEAFRAVRGRKKSSSSSFSRSDSDASTHSSSSTNTDESESLEDGPTAEELDKRAMFRKCNQTRSISRGEDKWSYNSKSQGRNHQHNWLVTANRQQRGRATSHHHTDPQQTVPSHEGIPPKQVELFVA